MNKIPFCPIRAALASALLLSGAAAHASDDGSSGSDRLVTIGLGPELHPKYLGSNGVSVLPLPDLSIRHVGEPIPFSAPDQGASLGLLGRGSVIDFGPEVRLRGKRNERDVGAAVGNVGFTVEAGGFVQAWAAPWLRLRVDGRQGIGGHKALTGDLSADVVLRDGDRTIFSVGPRLRLGDARFQRAYFGITPAVAARTGLPVYRPGGGIYAAGAVTSVVHQFDSKWGMTAYAGYDRLVRAGDVSPIVRRFGSRDQVSVGLGLTYTFAFHH
jgi:outer membrane scaffolding protein for murein synthesis (MipA/OmpV family)